MIRKLFILILFFGCKTPTNSNKNIETSLQKNEVTDTYKNAVILKPARVKAMTNDIMLEDTVEATIADRHYILYPDGKIAVKLSSSIQTDTFHLDTDLLIEEAYFFDYKENLIVYYASTDNDTGSSFVESYNRKTNKMIWKNDILGFNLTAPIVLDDMTYVAAISLIGKLNLDNGKFLWKHDDIYEKTKFDSYESIEIDGENVNFIQSRWIHDTKEPGRIIVNDKTGKIEKIIKNAP